MMENKAENLNKADSSVQNKKKLRNLTLCQWRLADPVIDLSRNIHNASDHVDTLLAKIGIKSGIDETKLREVWQKVSGDFIAKHTEPESLKEGILSLKVLQPSMRFHLEQMKGKIIKNLSNEIGKGVVKQVRFRTG